MDELVFYYTPFCPRSYFSFKNFKKEMNKTSNKGFKVKKVIFFKKENNLIFPPAIEFKGKFLKGLFLDSKTIANFLDNNYG